MPTVGWIQETATNRWTDAHPFKHDSTPRRIYCQLCERSFLDPEGLKLHLGMDHPLKQPLLQIGSEAGSAFVVRHRQALQQVTVHNATRCVVSEGGANPQQLSPAALRKLLQLARNTHFVIALHNERAIDGRYADAEVRVQVSIPDAKLVAKTDQLFQSMLAIDRPTTSVVQRFLDAAPTEPAVRSYAGALADYVLGVLIKEQDPSAGTVASLADFKSKFSSARHVLEEFDTPLAEAITAAIDLNLNYFRPDTKAAVPSLQLSHQFFGQFCTPDSKGPAPMAEAPIAKGPAACPVDRATKAILECVHSFGRSTPPNLTADILPGMENCPATDFDLAKAATLLAGAALLAGNKPAAVQQLRRLVHDHNFGGWAVKQLENLASND